MTQYYILNVNITTSFNEQYEKLETELDANVSMGTPPPTLDDNPLLLSISIKGRMKNYNGTR